MNRSIFEIDVVPRARAESVAEASPDYSDEIVSDDEIPWRYNVAQFAIPVRSGNRAAPASRPIERA
jgi:hypothetical protein